MVRSRIAHEQQCRPSHWPPIPQVSNLFLTIPPSHLSGVQRPESPLAIWPSTFHRWSNLCTQWRACWAIALKGSSRSENQLTDGCDQLRHCSSLKLGVAASAVLTRRLTRGTRTVPSIDSDRVPLRFACAVHWPGKECSMCFLEVRC